MPVNFMNNTRLSPENKDAVNHYRDTGVIPIPWKHKVSKTELNGVEMDCYMINGYCRGDLNKNNLDQSDVEILEYLVPTIQSAILNCKTDKILPLQRGLSYGGWLVDNYDEGDYLADKAFGSFTSNPRVAYKYAFDKGQFNGNKLLVFLDLLLKKNEKALYIDDRENEWLLPRNSIYKITEIKDEYLPNNFTALHYYIKKIK